MQALCQVLLQQGKLIAKGDEFRPINAAENSLFQNPFLKKSVVEKF